MKNRNLLLLLFFMAINQFLYSQKEEPYTLDYYLNKDNKVRLHEVVSVESSLNTLTIIGYETSDGTNITERKVLLDRGQVFTVSNCNWILKDISWRFWQRSLTQISISTVPFKIRPEIEGFSTNANSGLKNVGLNFSLLGKNFDRYFSDGTKSNHKINAGIWIAPTVEELDSIHTEGFLAKETTSKQLFLTTALTVNYTYNNITFSFIPIGFDFATTNIGKKWVYNEQRWWGFGIGLEPKIFNTLINK